MLSIDTFQERGCLVLVHFMKQDTNYQYIPGKWLLNTGSFYETGYLVPVHSRKLVLYIPGKRLLRTGSFEETGYLVPVHSRKQAA